MVPRRLEKRSWQERHQRVLPTLSIFVFIVIVASLVAGLGAEAFAISFLAVAAVPGIARRARPKPMPVVSSSNMDACHWQSVAAAVSDGVVAVDKAGCIRFANAALARMLGVRTSDLLGRSVRTLFDDAKGALDRRFLKRLLNGRGKGGIAGPLHLQGSRADGSSFPLSLTPCDRESGTPFVGVVKDLSELNSRNSAHQEINENLRHLEKLSTIGTLAGGIAHDLNNVLTPVIGYTHMALREVAENETLHGDLEKVLRSAGRARELVKKVLSFSRRLDPQRLPVHLHFLMEETILLLEAVLPATVEIVPEVDVDTPSVLGDPSDLQQVIMSLCTNSAHALPESGGRIDVVLEDTMIDAAFARAHPPLRPGPHARIEVRDTGCGMDPATQKRIFEPFYTTKGVGEGTGLGLFVVHGVVVAHGGGVFVRSTPGKGTIFEVFLPCAGTMVLDEPIRPRSIAEGKERVLFVDHEADIVEMMSDVLGRLGYAVTACGSPEQALALFAEDPHSFDVVVTDHTIPNTNGLAFARQIKGLRSDRPVVMIGDFSETVEELPGDIDPVAERLSKPVGGLELGAAIRSVMDGYSKDDGGSLRGAADGVRAAASSDTL